MWLIFKICFICDRGFEVIYSNLHNTYVVDFMIRKHNTKIETQKSAFKNIFTISIKFLLLLS